MSVPENLSTTLHLAFVLAPSTSNSDTIAALNYNTGVYVAEPINASIQEAS